MSSYQIDTILHFIVTKKYKQSNIIEKKRIIFALYQNQIYTKH